MIRPGRVRFERRGAFRARATLLAVVLGTGSAAAGFGWEGTLVLPSGGPAAHFQLSLIDRSWSTTTDGEGRFRFEPAPKFPVWVLARAPDGRIFGPIAVQAALERLELPATLKEHLIVVSGAAPRLELLAAAMAELLPEADLQRRRPLRVFQALEGLVGGGRLGDGPDAVPALRNLARGRTLILLDGVRVHAERRAGPSATFVEPLALEAIEVGRGPASVVYGSDAFGGVLQLLTRDGTPEASRARVSVEVGSLGGPGWAGYGAGSTRWREWELGLDGYWRSAEDQQAGGGQSIFNSSFESRGGSLRGRLVIPKGLFRASMALDRIQDLGKASIDSRKIRSFYPVEQSERVRWSWSSVIQALGDFDLVAGWDRYGLTLDRDRKGTASSNRRIDRAANQAEDLQIRASLEQPSSRGRVRIGVDLSGRMSLKSETEVVRFAEDAHTVVAVDRLRSIEDASQVTLGGFLTWDRPLNDRLSLGLGLRGDAVSTRNRGGSFGFREQAHETLSGSASLTWQLAAGLQVVSQLSRGFRSPTLSDRYFRGPSGRGFVIGNPELEPETSRQVDFKLDWLRGSHRFAACLYRYEIRNLIERYRQENDFRFRNQGRAVFTGVELEWRGLWGEAWGWRLGGVAARGETGGGAAVDDVAPPHLLGGLTWSSGGWGAWANLAAFAQKEDPGPTEVERAGYSRLDLGVSWQPVAAVSLELQLRNALDRRYFASADESADFAQGRTALLSFTWKPRWSQP